MQRAAAARSGDANNSTCDASTLLARDAATMWFHACEGPGLVPMVCAEGGRDGEVTLEVCAVCVVCGMSDGDFTVRGQCAGRSAI